MSYPPSKRHFEILCEALAEIKATSDGESDQPIADIVAGCIAEIDALPAATPAPAGEITELVERLRARRKKFKDYGANGWFETLEEDGDCNEAAASLASLSERLASSNRQLEFVDRELRWEGTGESRIERIRRALAAEAALAEARTALKELADLMDDVVTGNYKPDSFTTQPARTTLEEFK